MMVIIAVMSPNTKTSTLLSHSMLITKERKTFRAVSDNQAAARYKKSKSKKKKRGENHPPLDSLSKRSPKNFIAGGDKTLQRARERERERERETFREERTITRRHISECVETTTANK